MTEHIADHAAELIECEVVVCTANDSGVAVCMVMKLLSAELFELVVSVLLGGCMTAEKVRKRRSEKQRRCS